MEKEVPTAIKGNLYIHSLDVPKLKAIKKGKLVAFHIKIPLEPGQAINQVTANLGKEVNSIASGLEVKQTGSKPTGMVDRPGQIEYIIQKIQRQ